MRSPFPGMDPYLEAPTRWSGVHHRLLSAIADTLSDALAPAFIVAVEERVYIATPGDLLRMPWMQPDVFLVETAGPTSSSTSSPVITPPLLIEPLVEEEVRERYLEIVDVETRAVVTVIDVLSPTNKTGATTGRVQFLENRRRLLASQTNWVEIDLLRAGERPPEATGRGDYYALLHRGVPGSAYALWAAMLHQRLPVIGVPTRAPLPDTPLDLQAAVDSVYRRGHYELVIDYNAPVPAPPLAPDRARWAEACSSSWRRDQATDA